MNTFTAVGNTTKEVIYREKEKTQVASVSIAVNYKYKKEKRAYFVEVVLFGALAKIIADFKLEPGSLIFVGGELNVEEWTNEDGKTFKNLKLMANSFNVIKRGLTEIEKAQRQAETTKKEETKPEGTQNNEGWKTYDGKKK